MKNIAKKYPYGWYSVAAFIIIGYVIAFISPSHNYNYSLSWALAISTMLIAGLIISLLGFRQDKNISGKTIFLILSTFYFSCLIYIFTVFLRLTQ